MVNCTVIFTTDRYSGKIKNPVQDRNNGSDLTWNTTRVEPEGSSVLTYSSDVTDDFEILTSYTEDYPTLY